jgi:hypothetical protein
VGWRIIIIDARQNCARALAEDYRVSQVARRGTTVSGVLALASLYSWFTESFETADLKDAKAPLRELA